MFKKSPCLVKKDGNFCSRHCYDSFRGKQSERICANCGIVFNPHRFNASIYCSQKCSMTATANKNTCECKWCGGKFIIKDSVRRVDGNFCKRECYNAYRKSLYKTYVCVNCRCEFSRIPSRQVIKFCSRECHQEYFRGETHYLFKGGKNHYRGANWGKQRKLAYQRDKGICQYCHRKQQEDERQFQVHHITAYREFNGDYIAANNLRNLITLCHQCHPRAEAKLIPIQAKLF